MIQFFLVGIPLLLVIISIIVAFHEYGHYSVARLFNTRIERFSIGFGKILLRRKDKRGVEWCISALPLGGYVKFAGDENVSSMSPSAEELEAARASITAREGAAAVADYFHFKPLWQRALIIVAGPVFNFILAIALFTVMFSIIGDQIGRPTVAQVFPDTPAARAGFIPGDVIRRIDGRDVGNGSDVVMLVALRADSTFPIQVERAGKPVVLTVTPERAKLDLGKSGDEVSGGRIGIAIDDKIDRRPLNPAQAFVRANVETWATLDRTFTYLGRIFIGKENGDQLSGMIGMAKVTGDLATDPEMAQLPLRVQLINLFLRFLLLTATISIGVGFLNLLPVPMLDGGHLAFYAWQGITRKPISPAVQNVAFRIAVVLILGLMLFAAWNDLNRHFGGLFS
ncbi:MULTISPECIES: RIP metalloprotease [Asticcacaulis]|uniref:M50 family metallopeptidase n=1 Tax=Asticcacaulis TaxID=76890 RepID=UPI001FD91F46|nr:MULTISPECIES: RIP metalloprotease [Asticcacaulis]MBP2158343.1 regulator of sigma E protease [Asticcacaulis solisilvae]MDR6799388.1 regulator of sigma E protease [Asticcacaulis sp. BE141]